MSLSRAVGLSLGVAYIVTAFQPRRNRHWFLLAASPLRFLGGYLFLRDGRNGTALWDAVNGVVNLIVVASESKR